MLSPFAVRSIMDIKASAPKPQRSKLVGVFSNGTKIRPKIREEAEQQQKTEKVKRMLTLIDYY